MGVFAGSARRLSLLPFSRAQSARSAAIHPLGLGGILGCRGIIYMDKTNAVALIHGKAAVAKLRLNNLGLASAAAAAVTAESREPRAADTARQSRRRAERPTRRRAAPGKRQPLPSYLSHL